jgi:pyruvate formate lyase activating enzyme
LVYEVLKDRVYFEKSGGGVTASGGEALLQSEFVEEFFRRLKAEGVHTALDTAGCVPAEYMERVLPYTDLVLYDIKLMDSDAHRKFTGRGNEEVLRNLLYAAEFIRKYRSPVLWIRTPIIPGATSCTENIEGIGSFISVKIGDIVERWDLCAFNNLCRDKYKRLDRDWPYKDTPLMKKSEMERLAEAAGKSCAKKDIVHWSGAVMGEE